jgi:threonine/homoserine/homoserine lactone efflux protein
MLDLAWFASVIAFAVSMSATPGPNNTMVTASGATWGFRRTVPHIAGVSVGFPLMLLAVAFGLGELLRTRAWLQDGLRWVGAAYLLWLAWHIAAARPTAPGEGKPSGRPIGFWRAALFQWVNPKAWIIAAGAVVTYTTATGGAVLAQAVILAAIFLLITLPCLTFWTMVGVGAARVLRSPAAVRRFNWALAGLLVVSLIPILRGE